MQLLIWFITILLTAGLAACAPEVVPTPQPTPKAELAESITVTVEIIEPTFTVSPISTDTPHLFTEPPTETPTPEHTATAELPISDPTALPLEFQDGIENIMTLENTETIYWSPTYHEFFHSSCSDQWEDTTIHFVDLIDGKSIDITPAKIRCYLSAIWHPNGEYFLFSSEALSQDGYEGGLDYEWRVPRNNLEPISLGSGTSYWDWFNNDIIIHSEHIGTGTFYIRLFDTVKDEGISSTSFDGRAKDTSSNFVILNEELGFSLNTSVAILAQEPISPEYGGWLFGSDIKFFGKNLNDSGWEISYYSRYEDMLPNTDKILAVTWINDLNTEQSSSDTLSANLQLIDAQTDELTMVMPSGIYGRFSPDGSIVAAMTPDDSHPNLQLFGYPDGEKFLSLPAFAETVEYSAEVFAHTSFSPNGRYFTFFTPETDLIVYDIQTGEMLPPITAVPAEPLWSPDSTRFVYTDPVQGLAIYDTRSHTAYPLAESGGERLSDPQWSFDGAYLSVAYRTDHHTWQTAVLSLP